MSRLLHQAAGVFDLQLCNRAIFGSLHVEAVLRGFADNMPLELAIHYHRGTLREHWHHAWLSGADPYELQSDHLGADLYENMLPQVRMNGALVKRGLGGGSAAVTAAASAVRRKAGRNERSAKGKRMRRARRKNARPARVFGANAGGFGANAEQEREESEIQKENGEPLADCSRGETNQFVLTKGADLNAEDAKIAEWVWFFACSAPSVSSCPMVWFEGGILALGFSAPAVTPYRVAAARSLAPTSRRPPLPHTSTARESRRRRNSA